MEDKNLKGKTPSFCRKVWSLTWKNYLLKKRNFGMTLVEFLLPVIYLLVYLMNFGVFTKKDTDVDSYFVGSDFYTFVFYLSVVVATYISLCTFVNFQLPREKEINVTSTLEIMNVSRFASDLSFIII